MRVVAGLISSLVSEPTSADEESHIVDSPTDAEVDVGVKLSAASGVDASWAEPDAIIFSKIEFDFGPAKLSLWGRTTTIRGAMVASIPAHGVMSR